MGESVFKLQKTAKTQKTPNMPVFNVKVCFFNDVYKIPCDTDKPVADFRAAIEAESGIEAGVQKLKFGRKCVMPMDLESFAGWAGTEDMEKGCTADWAYKVTILD